jgi:predicted GNAT family acetyltransferase
MIDFDSIPVTDNPEKSRFEFVAGEDIAWLDYEREGDVIRYTHTEVPKALQGKGLGKKLAFAVLEYAQANNLEVEAICPVVIKAVKENPQYQGFAKIVEE